ncbi:MAG: glutathione peroxidase [Burkholderiaceae bacterium]
MKALLKSLFFPGFCAVAFSLAALEPAYASGTCPPLLDHRFKRLQDEAPQNLCQYAGNVILVVNTASYCGFTSQYEGLEKLYAAYRDKGFAILGFPSNDFGQQEPGSSKQIADLCFNTYGVKFPMFEKSSVTNGQQNPFYAQLISNTGQVPKWNFHKYLIDRKGKVIASYPSKVAPDDRQLRAAIEQALTSGQ